MLAVGVWVDGGRAARQKHTGAEVLDAAAWALSAGAKLLRLLQLSRSSERLQQLGGVGVHVVSAYPVVVAPALAVRGKRGDGLLRVVDGGLRARP